MGENFDACKGPNGPSLRRRCNNFKFNFKCGIYDLKRGLKKTYEKIMPDKIVKKVQEPIWTKAENIVPETEPIDPSIFPQTKCDVCNRYGVYDGLQYPEFEKVEDKLKVKTDLDVKASNVPGTLSGLSLLMNANDKSTLMLSDKAQDFGIGFKIINAYKGPRSENTVSEEEFLLFLENYAKDANSEKEEGDGARNRLAVHFDEKNKKELKKVFRVIAGEDNLITKKEFEAFWNEILANGEKNIDPVTGFELTKITGKSVNDIINKRLEQQGKLPTYRKTAEEIKKLEKEQELRDLKLNIYPDFVEKIEYSTDKKIAFVTLDDGTELQFPKESDAGCLNVTKEDERYVITNAFKGRRLKVVPSESSKITLRGGSNVIYSSPDNLNDDVVIEGDVKKMKLIVGTGEDNVVNNQENTSRDNTSDVTIVKDVSNNTVELEDKYDIAYTHVIKSTKYNNYYSAITTDIKKLQKENLDEFIVQLEKSSDDELLRVILKDKTDKDINNLTIQELLELANINGFEIVGNGDDFALTPKQRKNFLKNYRKEQIDNFKEINKEGRKEEKPLKKTTESNP